MNSFSYDFSNFRSLCHSGGEDCCDHFVTILLCDIWELLSINFVPGDFAGLDVKNGSIDDVVEKDLPSINLLCLVNIGTNIVSILST